MARQLSMSASAIDKRRERHNRRIFDAERARFGLAPLAIYRGNYHNNPVRLQAEATLGGWSTQSPEPDSRVKKVKGTKGKVAKAGKVGKVRKGRANAKVAKRKTRDSEDGSEGDDSDTEDENEKEDSSGDDVDGGGSDHREDDFEEEEKEDGVQPEGTTGPEQNEEDDGSWKDVDEQDDLNATVELTDGSRGVEPSVEQNVDGVDPDEDDTYAPPSTAASNPPPNQQSQTRTPTRSVVRPAVIEFDEHHLEDEEEDIVEEGSEVEVYNFPPHALSRAGMLMLLGATRRNLSNRPQDLANAENALKDEMRLRGFLGPNEDC